jgi:hypothetical protein
MVYMIILISMLVGKVEVQAYLNPVGGAFWGGFIFESRDNPAHEVR